MRRRFFAFLAVIAACAFATPQAHAANDPTLLWHTLETPHFRITYYSGEQEAAQHVADLAEVIHARLAPVLGTKTTSERTEIVLSDQTDGANGSATALPFNTVRLNLTAPDDLSPLGDVDDWYLELVTHEYTHILHTDYIRGIPALVNAVLGKTLAPNQVQPRWLLEGLAVFEESSKTSGGRLRSSQWNMYMRADVLEDYVATLDQFSNSVRRWPQGNLWYLYGSFFLRWIAETYGEDAIKKMIDDYGRQIVPYGINRSIRRATGRTFEELYPAWIATLRRAYTAEADEVRARGLREGVRLTTGGQGAQHPRWIPNNAWPDHKGDLLYLRDDAHTRAGLYALPVDRDAQGNVTKARETDRELLVRTSGDSSASFEPDGSVVFNSPDVFSNLFTFNDLFELKTGLKSPSGLDGQRTRWTNGFRASDPSVSPDGRHVVFTTNHRGTTYLQIGDITPSGLENVRALVKSARFEQAFTPRFSPDGRHVAYSSWTQGGYRDVRLVDIRDGSYVSVARDRAVDGGPSFSPDGKWLMFHSDRTGIMNVYAWEVAQTTLPSETRSRLKQVTNVLNGAYQPEVSPDGKTIAYLGYTSRGFDLFAIPFNQDNWLDALPYVNDHPAPPPEPPHFEHTVHAYNPLLTLMPRHYSVQITPGNFGQAVIVSAVGSDVAGHHGVAASLRSELEKPELQGSLNYTYGRLPIDINMGVYRSISPRGGYALGQYKPSVVSEAVGVETGVGYSLPRAFDSQSFSVSYSVARTGAELPTPIEKLDPYETPIIPTRGMLGFIHLGYAYSNAERFLWSVGPERGFSIGANVEITDPALASDFTGYSSSFNFISYHLMPWFQHHSLALHFGGGMSGGNYPGRGAFFVGGYQDLPLVDTVRNTLIQGGVVLRGYPVVVEAGRNYALFNGEYRFPIVNIDRGPSTLPIFLNRITGNVFVDYGSAFDDAATAKFKTGTGAELWFDATLGYIVGFTFRLGFAHGWASGGMDKLYFAATVPF